MRHSPKACKSNLPIKPLGSHFHWVGLVFASLFVMVSLRLHTNPLSFIPTPLLPFYIHLWYYYAAEQEFSLTTLEMHQVWGVFVFAPIRIRVSGAIEYVRIPSLTPASMHCKGPSFQHTQGSSVKPDTLEVKADSRTGMVHPPIHTAGRSRLGGMFPRTWTSLYISRLKFISLHKKQKLNLALGVKKVVVVMGQINFWHEKTQLSLILMTYGSNLSSV